MRHWLGRLLPVVAIALLVQVLAPVGAFRAFAEATSDPLAFAPICTGQHEPGQGGATGQDNPFDSTGQKCCGFCAAVHCGAAALDPPCVDFVVRRRCYQRMVWLPDEQVVAPWRIGSNSQARAPPAAL